MALKDPQAWLLAGGVAAAVGTAHFLAHRQFVQTADGVPKDTVLKQAGWTQAGIAVTGVSFAGTLAALEINDRLD